MYQNMHGDMTVRALITTLNKQLSDIYAKPIIKKGYNGFDYTNGRRYVTASDIMEVIHKMCGDYYFVHHGIDIIMYGTELVLKAKRKKYNPDDVYSTGLTIVGLEPRNPAVLDKTVHQVYLDSQQKHRSEEMAQNKNAEIFKAEFEKKLAKYGMSFEVFKQFYDSAKYADYATRKLMGID